MPSLHLILTSATQKVSIPSQIRAKHLHLKMVSAKFDTAPATDNLGMEIQLPFLRHYYQINSSYNRPNICIPLDSSKNTTIVYPDVVLVGASVAQTFEVKLLSPGDGSSWTDSGGAVIKSVHVLFEYVVASE